MQQLVVTVPTAGEEEMSKVKECIVENPNAAKQLDVLTQMLTVIWEAEQQQQQTVSVSA